MAAGRIIARHSTNRTDIRDVVGGLIPFDRTSRVLDLGCGYGFLYDALQGRIRPATRVVGVDRNEVNRSHFEARVTRCGGVAEFHPHGLPASLPWEDGWFDTVLSIFSLYFFPAMVPEIRRVLRPGGCFVAVTHCNDSFSELNRLVRDDRVFGVLAHFNDSNALAILSPHFSSVRSVRYDNRLLFSRADADDLEKYLRFKRPDWMGDAQVDSIIVTTRDLLSRQDLVVTKNDIIYVCSP